MADDLRARLASALAGDNRGRLPADHEEWCAFWTSDGVDYCDCPPIERADRAVAAVAGWLRAEEARLQAEADAIESEVNRPGSPKFHRGDPMFGYWSFAADAVRALADSLTQKEPETDG